MDSFTIETVRALIGRKRVNEMLARGWRILGPGEEGSLWMEGPDPDSAPMPMSPVFQALGLPAWEAELDFELLDRAA